jgi:hypothetical protein
MDCTPTLLTLSRLSQYLSSTTLVQAPRCSQESIKTPGTNYDSATWSSLVSEFHALLTLDDGETIRVIIPEAFALPEEHTSYLFCDSQFLLAGHAYHSDLRKPKIEFKQGGIHTMNVIKAQKSSI